MKTTGQEIEVKFYTPNLQALEDRLKSLGASLAQPRTHEVNLRFDTPDSALSRNFQVLRLRQDTHARLTYKGPGQDQGGARLRQELEFTVSDFEAARRFLEALGYQVFAMYEKYRTEYALEGAIVTLDEMPYGNFAEIEGTDGASIEALASKLGFEWDKRILESYMGLFDLLKARLGLTFRDLTFENFRDLPPQEF